jgi:MoxR-like ATPase
MNDAFLDRFGARVQFSYLPKDQEVRTIVARTGCTKELATLLVDAAIVTRAGADTGALSDGISLRRLFAWAEMLTDGIGAEVAFQCAVLNAASDQDRETLRQQCLLAYDRSAVARALDPVAAAVADAETAAAVAAATAAADAIPLAN